LYYVSKVDIAIIDGCIQATETILTRADNFRATRETFRRMEHIGIENIAICEYKASRYKKLIAAQNKRRKAAKKMTAADIAEIQAHFQREEEA
jgi:hypothetical protein